MRTVIKYACLVIVTGLVFFTIIQQRGSRLSNQEHIGQYEEIVQQNPEIMEGFVETDKKLSIDPKIEQYTALLTEAMKKVDGNCQWGFHIFGENLTYSTESYPVPSASVIKVYIMEYAYDLIMQNKLDLTDILSGCSVEYLLNVMITRSNNEATNILIDYFGMEELNDFFVVNGYTETKLERKMLDTKAQNEGRDNYTSIADVMKFLDKLYANKDIEPYSDMLEIMKQQQVRTKIPRKFPSDVVIASKTGELSTVENDIGIIFGENDFSIAFLCNSISDTQKARQVIGSAAYDLYLKIQEKYNEINGKE